MLRRPFESALHRKTTMQACSTSSKRCSLVRPIRDREGYVRFGEAPEILREIENLGRCMFLVRFCDGSTTFLFAEEIILSDEKSEVRDDRFNTLR